MIKTILLVFAGGGLGSALRYLTGKWFSSLFHLPFPVATLMINVTACFILGWLVGTADHKQWLSASSRLFWAVGFCGGFSTFSTFSQETFSLLNTHLTFTAVLYMAASVALCLGATFGGVILASHR